MKKIMVIGMMSLISLWTSSSLHAQIKVVRGEATVTVEGLGSTSPSDTDRRNAMNAAKVAAWRSYLALPGQNERVDQIRANEKTYLDRIDDLLVDVVIVDENYNKDTKRYNVRIKATVAESVISSMIRNGNSTAGRANVAGTSTVGPGAIVILGMSREAEVVKSFLVKETRITETSAERSNSSRTSDTTVGRKGNQTSVSSDSSQGSNLSKDVTGGNREQKRDKVTYKIGNLSLLNNNLPRILLQSGIRSTPYAFLMRPCKLPNPDSFSKQYANSEQGELPSQVMAEIQERLFDCGRAKYWVFASMAADGYTTDPNTGLSLANVNVSVQLMEIETGAVLGSASKDVSGRANDQTAAIGMATERAIQAVGDIIAAQVATIGK